MKIFLREIRTNGIELDRIMDSKEIGPIDQDVHLATPLRIQGKITRVGDTVLAQLQLQSTLSFLCSRCLEQTEKSFSRKTDFDYLIDPKTEFVELGEDIRQEIVLGATWWSVCSENCQGICPGCGMNLNQNKCNCNQSGHISLRSQVSGHKSQVTLWNGLIVVTWDW